MQKPLSNQIAKPVKLEIALPGNRACALLSCYRSHMNQLLLLSLALMLSGCVGTATVVSCGVNSNQYPEKEAYSLLISATVSTERGEASNSIPMQCTYKERRCGGGDWYFKWNEVREKELTFSLGNGKSLTVESPNCTMALEHLGKDYLYGNSFISYNGQKLSISNQEIAQSAASSVLGVQLLSLKVTEHESD